MNHNYYFEGVSTKLSPINNILPRPELQWVYSDNCYQCKSKFGIIINKQHHCRSCGRCFCSSCCKTIKIPYHLTSCPPEKQTYKETAKSIGDTVKNLSGYVYKSKTGQKTANDLSKKEDKLVCNDCFTRLTHLKQIEYCLAYLEWCDLKTLNTVATVSQKYYYSYIYIMYKFWKIQSKDIRKCSAWEINMIRSSNIYFRGHNSWNKQYIKYALIENYSGKTVTDIFNEQLTNVRCSSLMCSDCTNREFDIFDLMEMLSYIVYLENISSKKIFWQNDHVKKIFFDFINKVKIEHNDILLTSFPLFVKLLSILFSSVTEEQYAINKELIVRIFDLLCPNSKMLSHMANTIILFFDGFMNDHVNFAFVFKEYISNSKNLDNNEIKSMKKSNKFFFDKICLVSFYKFEDPVLIEEIKNELKTKIIKYPFDNNYVITDFHGFIDLNSFSSVTKYGLLGNRGVRLSIKKENEETKFVTLIIKGLELYEHCNYILIKMLSQKYGFSIELPINDVYMLRQNLYLIRIEDDITILSSIYGRKLDIKDHIFETNSQNQLGQIIKNYCQSLSFLYSISHLFNINIRNHDQIVINSKGQIYFSRFSEDEKKSNYEGRILPLTDIIGSKNSIVYKTFCKETIQLYKKMKFIKSSLPIIYDVIIKNQLREQIELDIEMDISEVFGL
jgi:hypothetical protein